MNPLSLLTQAPHIFSKIFGTPIALAQEVNEKPRKVRALLQDLVVYRRPSDKELVVLSDVCVHRKASLSLGKLKGDHIECPYHGWQYNAKGMCTLVPSEKPGTPVAGRARLDSYPVIERFGLVWAFLGDLPEAERPPLPVLPEFGQPGWRAVWGEFTWNAHYTRVVENTVDVAHTPFVHANTFGNTKSAVMPSYEVIHDDYSMMAAIELEAPEPKGISKLVMGKNATNKVELGIYMPSSNRVGSALGTGWRIVLLLAHLPVDERTTKTFFVQLRDFFTFGFADNFSRKFTYQIINEDKLMVESQNPQIVPLKASSELSNRSDRLAIEYRKALLKATEAGWAIDVQKVRHELDKEGNVLLVPCPERRAIGKQSAWVMGEAPTLSTSAQ